MPRPIIRPIGPSIAYVELTQGQFACIDAEDIQDIAQFNWCAFKSASGSFYAGRGAWNKETKKVTPEMMHVRILGKHETLTVDHINCTSTLDNRRANLRYATYAEQSRNRAVRKDCIGGQKGIRLERSGKWIAQIRHNGQYHYLGSHATAELASEAYRVAAKRLHGDFARMT